MAFAEPETMLSITHRSAGQGTEVSRCGEQFAQAEPPEGWCWQMSQLYESDSRPRLAG